MYSANLVMARCYRWLLLQPTNNPCYCRRSN